MRQPCFAGLFGAWVCALLTPGCNDALVERVPADVCASGLRWAGELTPNEEMYPGHDCVGCHRAKDGPEFLAAGTIYGVVDPEGTRTTRNDCFGLEGAHVSITGADGHVFQTVTNRAGNFFFEGREELLVKPFRVVIGYDLPGGGASREPMATSPSYGGCARCHNPEADPTPDAGPGRTLGPDEVVPHVYPIYTGPLQP
jgi:hypothetical protein